MLTRNKALNTGFLLASGLCFVQQAAAIDLGELVLESSLNEPLDARVALEDVAGVDPSQISVSLGTADDFAAVGIELSDVASQVQFAVEVDGATGAVHLTTADPINEPYLDLLLIVAWPDGMVQRDYTILVNLAGSTATAFDSLAIPRATNSADPEAAADSPQPVDQASSNGDGQTYAVANGDSMWEIAARTRPSQDVGMHQMMLAIQRANEDAFINNNINRVLSGKVLRIPTLQEINLVDQNTAVEQVNQQNQQLSSQPLAINRSTGNTDPAPQQDQLTVLTDDQAAAPGIGGDSGLGATVAALESEMMLSEESLDRARLENTELTSRFKMLEEEMDLLQNLIAVEDARIAQLQADLTAQAETTEQALATTEAATGVMAAQQSEPPPDAVNSVEGWLQNTAVLMGVIVSLLLMVLGYLFWQRRRMDAAVYAFDSGIPELETAENSTFTAERKSGGLFGRFANPGSKRAARNIDPEFTAAADRPVEPVSIYARAATPVMAETQSVSEFVEPAQDSYDVAADRTVDDLDYAFATRDAGDENIAVQTPVAVAAVDEADSALLQDTRTAAAVDDAALADELIAEARGADNYAGISVETEETPQARKEAHELAEIVAPDDVAITEAAIPEAFEFTLTTAPEPVFEEPNSVISQDIESFAFQSTGDASEELRPSTAKRNDLEFGAGEDDPDFSALLLDDDEAEFPATTPMNECDTKLDLAVAYEAMGDIEGAIEILDEVIADGNEAQVAEANRLKGSWRNS